VAQRADQRFERILKRGALSHRDGDLHRRAGAQLEVGSANRLELVDFAFGNLELGGVEGQFVLFVGEGVRRQLRHHARKQRQSAIVHSTEADLGLLADPDVVDVIG